MEDVRLSLSKNKGFPCCLFCYTWSPAFWSARQTWQTWQTWFPQSLSTCAIWRLSYWYILLIWKELERQERRATASHRASSAFLFKSLAEGQRWNWVVFAESKRQYKAKLVSLKPLTNKGLIFVQLICPADPWLSIIPVFHGPTHWHTNKSSLEVRIWYGSK